MNKLGSKAMLYFAKGFSKDEWDKFLEEYMRKVKELEQQQQPIVLGMTQKDAECYVMNNDMYSFSVASDWSSFAVAERKPCTRPGPNQRTKCKYCHGKTKTDDNGNCKACGAPKDD